MVERPRISQEPDGWHIIWDVYQVRPRGNARFLGWVLIIAALGFVLYDVRGWQFHSGVVGLFLPVVTAILGVVLLGFGNAKKVIERPLLRVKAGTEDMPPKLERPAPEGPHHIAVDELTHVVFGLIDVPWPGRQGVEVEAFAVYLAKEDGTPIPVIDGTLDKLQGVHVARVLASLLGLQLIELGKGA